MSRQSASPRIVSLNPAGEGRDFRIAIPSVVSKYIVEKGSIAVDGISLTVTATSDTEFSISVIPHTVEATTLRDVRIGDMVNIETDLIAKHIEKLMVKPDGITMGLLTELGFE